MTQHKLLPESQLHEPKGATLANEGEVYVATGSTGSPTYSGIWTALDASNVPGTVSQGWWDYNDDATASAAIPLTLADTQYALTNDGLGTNTNKTYGLSGITDIWDTSTNRFDFDNGGVLSLGDTVDVRYDIEVTTAGASDTLDISVGLAEGSGAEYQLPVNPHMTFKTAGTYRVVGSFSVYLGDANTLSYPAKLLASCDNTGATIKVNGWYIRALKNN